MKLSEKAITAAARIFFVPILMYGDKTVFEQKLIVSLVVFFVQMRQFLFDFCGFVIFFGSDFFLNGFPNQFIVHSRPIFF